MKRAMAVVAATALGLVAFTGTAGSAGAAGIPVTHVRSNLAFADAGWFKESGDKFWATGVSAVKSLWGSGSELHLSKTSGTMGGARTEVSADVTSGFTFTVDAKRLGSASVSATDLPAIQCTYDENGEQVGECTDTTVDVNVTWSGQGAISQGSYTEHVRTGGSMMRLHVLWTSREAGASGSLNGALSAHDLESAGLRTEKQVKSGR
ncbi:hypothetical protein FHX52_0744 [Humibacillus xanthopallidus]|uniref:Uncharacterized protein n=1 Tax=Humibacillus xanthopallidus TaxID=412689 RepID=A0A543PU92_9MICO|nr:hypothetical protein [Humibacillus xanthopallidus]TQN47641.1 hypothetical protein FHX52_0744 [Humibacillus xanthopallidus]